jgi:hypothetical protein
MARPRRKVTEHGTYACYRHSGCRCAECRNARRIEAARQKAKRYARTRTGTAPDFTHGPSGYDTWGCRCRTCTTGHSQNPVKKAADRRWTENHRGEKDAATVARRRRDQAATLDQASRRGQPWTGPELELAARSDLSAKAIALMIGRTRWAVQTKRYELRAEPKIIEAAGLSRGTGYP